MNTLSRRKAPGHALFWLARKGSTNAAPLVAMKPLRVRRLAQAVRADGLEVGQWGLIPWFSPARRPTGKAGRPISTNNCRIETVATDIESGERVAIDARVIEIVEGMQLDRGVANRALIAGHLIEVRARRGAAARIRP